MPARFETATEVRSDALTRTPSGALPVSAVLTRPGVFNYTEATTGRVVREWRPEEEVHAPESLASLEDAPLITGRHPREGVNPRSYGALTVGHVRANSLGRDSATGGVASKLLVGRQDAIDSVIALRSKGLTHDVSCGYEMRIDPTPGVVPAGHADAGKPYDRVQRGIVYNHVLMLEPGAGRLGRQCSMRLDSAENQISDERPEKMKLTLAIARFLKAQGRADATDSTVDGDESAVQAAVTSALTEAGRALDAVTARADAAEARLAAVDAANAKTARTALEGVARAVLGKDWRADAAEGKPKTDREIKIEVIGRVSPSMRLDSTHSDTYVDAAFALATAPATSTGHTAPAVVAVLNGGGSSTAPTGRADQVDVTVDPRTIVDNVARARHLQATANHLHLRK